MNANATVVVSALLSIAAAVAVSLSMRPAEVTPPVDSLSELRREVADVRAANAELQRRLDVLRDAPAPAVVTPVAERSDAPAMSAEQVAQAVEAYLKQRGGDAQPASASGKKSVTFDVAKEFATLKGTNYWENTEAWKRAFEAGQIDEVIKQFEALVKANPNDIPTQMNLANAYMANLQMDQSKWQLSMKADAVFDKVLELDSGHWEARFTKAVSYTFYPDFLGKKKDAIQHFETLVEQQEHLPVQSGHAETYLYLGNLLETRDPARAKEIWSKGARRHPDNTELSKKLAQ